MPSRKSFQDLITILQDLRHPETGCPWDRDQTFESIAPYTIEEAHEVKEAIENDDMENLKEELGDLLLQVVYHSQIATERNLFTIEDVVDGICRKMIRRHPHVYGDLAGKKLDKKQIEHLWQKIKADEKAQS